MNRALIWCFQSLFYSAMLFVGVSFGPGANLIAEETMTDHTVHPHIYHLVQSSLWDTALATGEPYYPPTYDQDGFTHATANPDKLLSVANHFYTSVPGKWYCLQMTVESLEKSGVKTIFEGTAAVGDIQPEFDGSEDELFPHILGGIKPMAVLESFAVIREADGTFSSITGITD